jgi:hypothetical protein
LLDLVEEQPWEEQVQLLLVHWLMSQSICEGLCLKTAGGYSFSWWTSVVLTVMAGVVLSEREEGDQGLILVKGEPRLRRRMVKCALTFGRLRGKAYLTGRGGTVGPWLSSDRTWFEMSALEKSRSC